MNIVWLGGGVEGFDFRMRLGGVGIEDMWVFFWEGGVG